MTQKIKIGAVSYLNTKPLIYGIEQGMLAGKAELTIDYPAKIAEQLIEGSIDAGLLPIAALSQIKPHYIVSDYGIACNGEVASVGLFSNVPVAEIKTILMDYQSRTSVALLKIIVKELWKLTVQFEEAKPGFENEIKGTTAGLVIGDRAFIQKQKSAYYYDLGTAWKELTGLPFVFAAWVANKKLDQNFIDAFNTANAFGLQHLKDVIQQNATSGIDLETYYTKNIYYKLNAEMLQAVRLFLSKI